MSNNNFEFTKEDFNFTIETEEDRIKSKAEELIKDKRKQEEAKAQKQLEAFKSKFCKDFFNIINDADIKQETKTERLQILTTPTLHKALKQIQKTSGISKNELINLAIISAIKNYKKSSLKG